MEDIFSFKEIEQIKTKEIFIDTREKNSMVPSYLFKISKNAKFKKLEVGDYLIGDIIIERKSAPDFFSSIYSGRLKEQLSNIIKYKNKIILIEGIYDYKKFNKKVFWGFFLSWCMKCNIPILLVNNEKESAEFINFISKKVFSNKKIKLARNKILQKDKKVYFLEGILGIGEIRARELLDKYGNIKEIINAPREDLKNILPKKVLEEFVSVIE